MFSRFKNFISRHLAALGYVCRVILPEIFKHGRRPVVFERLAGIGDIICSIPAARMLKERHPGARFIYNCHPDLVVIPKLFGIADRVTACPAMGLVSHWYGFLLAGKYEFIHGEPFTVRTTVRDYCDQYQLPPQDEHPHLELPDDLRERARKILLEKGIDPGSFITIHPGPTGPVREWPRDRWCRLVTQLQAAGQRQIVQLGVGHYYDRGVVVMEPIPGAVSLLDALSLEESVAVIALAKVHIGVDSGLLHVAAAVGTPGIGIFGNTLPEYRFSEAYRRTFVVSQIYCRGCAHYLAATPFINDCPEHIRCMKEIQPETVLRACLDVLQLPAK